MLAYIPAPWIRHGYPDTLSNREVSGAAGSAAEHFGNVASGPSGLTASAGTIEGFSHSKKGLLGSKTPQNTVSFLVLGFLYVQNHWFWHFLGGNVIRFHVFSGRRNQQIQESIFSLSTPHFSWAGKVLLLFIFGCFAPPQNFLVQHVLSLPWSIPTRCSSRGSLMISWTGVSNMNGGRDDNIYVYIYHDYNITTTIIVKYWDR